MTSEEFFSEIYSAYCKRIYNYIYGRIPNHEAAEDIAAEVFVAVWKNLWSYDASKGNMSTWLYTIAANKTTNYIKQARIRREVSVAELPEDTAQNFSDEANSLSSRILSRLTDEECEFLMMRYALGLSNEEIAKILGGTSSSISARYSRLLKKCRRLA